SLPHNTHRGCTYCPPAAKVGINSRRTEIHPDRARHRLQVCWLDVQIFERTMPVAELNNPTTLLPKLTLVPKSEDDQQSSRVDDSRLIRLAQQGDTQAFEELVRQYDRAVLRLAIHLTGSLEDG